MYSLGVMVACPHVPRNHLPALFALRVPRAIYPRLHSYRWLTSLSFVFPNFAKVHARRRPSDVQFAARHRRTGEPLESSFVSEYMFSECPCLMLPLARGLFQCVEKSLCSSSRYLGILPSLSSMQSKHTMAINARLD